MTRLYKLICIIAISLITTLYGDCILGLDIDDISWDGKDHVNEYDITDTVERGQREKFLVTHQHDDRCYYFVTFSKGQAGSYTRCLTKGSDILNYNIYDKNSRINILKEFPEASDNNDVISGKTNKGGNHRKEEKYYLSIPPNQIIPPGIYTDTFTAKVYEGEIAGTFTERNTESVTFCATVPEVVQVSLIDTGEDFDHMDTSHIVDFGDITGPETIRFDMRIRANVGYTVAMTSENGGSMVGINNNENTLPYVLQVDGITAPLSSGGPVNVASGTDMTTLNGDRHAISISVDPISNPAKAGDYRDIVYVQVSST